jgi:pilus assembly protein Flp/PilA
MHRIVKLASSAAVRVNGLARDEAGTTAIEYALIGTGISIAILAAVSSIGGSVATLFDTVAAAF